MNRDRNDVRIVDFRPIDILVEKKAVPKCKAVEKKFVSFTKTLLNDSSSRIMWCHCLRKKRFVATAEIDLNDSNDFDDFMTPELGKLCEKFFKL